MIPIECQVPAIIIILPLTGPWNMYVYDFSKWLHLQFSTCCVYTVKTRWNRSSSTEVNAAVRQRICFIYLDRISFVCWGIPILSFLNLIQLVRHLADLMRQILFIYNDSEQTENAFLLLWDREIFAEIVMKSRRRLHHQA